MLKIIKKNQKIKNNNNRLKNQKMIMFESNSENILMEFFLVY